MNDSKLTAELVEAVADDGERDRLASRVATAIRRVGGYQRVGIYDASTEEIAVLDWDGPAPPAHPRFPPNDGLCGAAVASGEAVIGGDVGADPRYLTTHLTTRSEIVVRILRRELAVGLIDVASERRHAFGERDKQLPEGSRP